MAAVTAARLGMKCCLIEYSNLIGGMMTAGLNATDSVNRGIITGVPRNFFRDCQSYYSANALSLRIESRVAEMIFERMLADAGVSVQRASEIVELEVQEKKISRARLRTGRIVSARFWIDASYEGDLMPLARVPFSVGRESASEFSETLAGLKPCGSMVPWKDARFDPFTKNGSLLPFVEDEEHSAIGSSDQRVQSYSIRITLTNDPKNRRPIEKPANYNVANYELFRRIASASVNYSSGVTAKHLPGLGTTFRSGYFNLAELPNSKYDMNSGHVAPTNNPYLNGSWIDKPSLRTQIYENFKEYSLGLIYFIQNDGSVPHRIRDFLAEFGLPIDEYVDNGNFPQKVYIREGRRLKGQKTFTQQHVEGGFNAGADRIGAGQYHLDCKPVSWRIDREKKTVVREGMFFSERAYRYELPVWLMMPRREDCENLLVVCGVSASHVAFGSIRMEPTWMEIGASAGACAVISVTEGRACDTISGAEITRKHLEAAKGFL